LQSSSLNSSRRCSQHMTLELCIRSMSMYSILSNETASFHPLSCFLDICTSCCSESVYLQFACAIICMLYW
jgi:hypothetical protein